MQKITKRQQKWIEIITKCGGVFKYFNSHGNPNYQILNSSQEISRNMVERLIRKGLLIPQNDGMLGESQTYKTIQN